MKRKYSVVKKVLEAVEAKTDKALVFNRADHEVHYHACILNLAGFLVGTGTLPGEELVVHGLTWQGHNLLDTIRDRNTAKDHELVPTVRLMEAAEQKPELSAVN